MPPDPERVRIAASVNPEQHRLQEIWSPEARADLRAIDRAIALEILHCLDRYLATHNRDIVNLKPPLTGFRLRCGDDPLFFDFRREDAAIEITSIRNRREAYR